MNELLRLIGVTLDIDAAKWPPVIGKDTPLVIIANHPFGIGDGIAIMALAERLGRPFRIIVHSELLKVPELVPFALPIDFSETREAFRFNLRTRDAALDLVSNGGVIVVFPSGGVATASTPFGIAEELPWKPFVARLVQSARASVLPVYFHGQNSWRFHAASHVSETLRLSLLVSEFARFAGSTVRVRIGSVLPYKCFEAIPNRAVLTHVLYEQVRRLGSGEPLRDQVYEEDSSEISPSPV
jgi:putative hemolysin